MDNIARLVIKLKGSDYKVCVETCAWLALEPELSHEKVISLKEVLSDPDPHVAQSVRRRFSTRQQDNANSKSVTRFLHNSTPIHKELGINNVQYGYPK